MKAREAVHNASDFNMMAHIKIRPNFGEGLLDRALKSMAEANHLKHAAEMQKYNVESK